MKWALTFVCLMVVAARTATAADLQLNIRVIESQSGAPISNAVVMIMYRSSSNAIVQGKTDTNGVCDLIGEFPSFVSSDIRIPKPITQYILDGFSVKIEAAGYISVRDEMLYAGGRFNLSDSPPSLPVLVVLRTREEDEQHDRQTGNANYLNTTYKEKSSAMILPPSAETRVEKRLGALPISIDALVFFRRPQYEYLVFSVEMRSGGFDSIRHTTLVLRKLLGDKDWTAADLAQLPYRPSQLMEMSEDEIQEHFRRLE